jgi:hypothetical protein
MLTETVNGINPGTIQEWASWMEPHIPHWLIGKIRPHSSARGMNSAGDTLPRSGWVQ